MANESTITCEQAIFTSLRTPTGEGYRIIAASPGLKADERREITRNSPSHGALCQPIHPSDAGDRQHAASDPADGNADAEFAVAFYPLSSGRYCVGLSLPAGAEHTGRGGDRIYTHVVVFDKLAFAEGGYSPFTMARSMIDEGLAEPQLKPPAKLTPLTLNMPESPTAWMASFGSIGEGHQLSVLTHLLDQKVLVVHAASQWIEAAEAFWLGLPGPFREKLSMSAGLKFASARSYNLQLLADEKGAAKSRTAGSRAHFVDTVSDAADDTNGNGEESAWATFVQRGWSQGDWDGLARRTSLPFFDSGPTGRQRVGVLYNELDELPNYESMRLISNAAEHLDRSPECRVEQGIVAELIGATQHTLLSRMGSISWPGDEPLWRGIVRLWRQCEPGTAFAQPLISACLRAVSTVDPIGAAEAALDVACEPPAHANRERLQSAIVEVLARWADALGRLTDASGSGSAGGEPDARVVRSREGADRWKSHRPDCDIVKRVSDRCEQLLTQGCGSPG